MCVRKHNMLTRQNRCMYTCECQIMYRQFQCKNIGAIEWAVLHVQYYYCKLLTDSSFSMHRTKNLTYLCTMISRLVGSIGIHAFWIEKEAIAVSFVLQKLTREWGRKKAAVTPRTQAFSAKATPLKTLQARQGAAVISKWHQNSCFQQKPLLGQPYDTDVKM